ncbi:hypothetical protein ACJMK2_043495 [Sinanodonta woodiana]|uniref:Mab-21-like HhH/H2TH-like domain-containing protein n=1 Tax=Sinanodonta woodiana TaxID=1069815 RepID=A0ABD3W0A1_SINWO
MALEENQSLYVSGILAAMGFSKREVNIRRFKWKFVELTDNLLLTYRKDIRRCIHSGSASEGMSGGPYYGGLKSDFDTMNILTYVKVVDEKDDSVGKEDACPDNIPKITVREIPDKDYPGYVRLIVVRADPVFLNRMPFKDDQYFLSNTLITQLEMQHEGLSNVSNKDHDFRKHQITKSHLHGPAISCKVSQPESTLSMLCEMLDISDDAESNDQDASKSIKSSQYADLDIVSCIMSLRWPYESIHFMTRPRPGHWPKKETVEYLVDSTPIFLAPVGHKSSPDVDLQWRPSFNVAEKLLIEDFNQTQIQCYALLKIILKDCLKLVSPNILSSYCMKTTMFWLSEREGSDNMIPTKLLHYFIQCLKLIQTWLESQRMPHYFIETRNVFPSNFDPAEVKELMQAIDKVMLGPISALENCKTFELAFRASAGDPLLFPKLSARSYLFAWIEMRCGILENMYTSGANRRLWKPYDTRNISECIERFKHMVEDTQTLEYGQHLLKIFKSFLGFVCFADYYDRLETTEDELSVKEIETLLLEGKDGDLALCPLKLATFYLRQNKIDEVLTITTSVLQQQQQIQNRHTFVDNLFIRIYEEFQLLVSIKDMKTLEHLVDIATANFSAKTHYDEVYCKEDCTEARQFLHFPIELAKNLTFDVTFMLPESSALPRAVQLEVVFSEPIELDENYCIGVTISPLVYTLYLRFLAFKAKLDLAGCIMTLSEFQDLLPSESLLNQASGYNLLASCYGMIGRSHDAVQSLCYSLRINPTRNNVAFGYFAFVYSVLFH